MGERDGENSVEGRCGGASDGDCARTLVALEFDDLSAGENIYWYAK